jgi:orotidine-5'-phosphate decarboxylase
MTFGERLNGISQANDSLLCVGLDIDTLRLPAPLRDRPDGPIAFAEAIVAATADLVCAYKPNLAFYLAGGVPGLSALVETVAIIRRLAPAVPVILDAKFNDIDSTAAAYARFAFGVLGVDAVTVNPYLGEDALGPFFGEPGRTAFVVCKTSNAGSSDLQDLPIGDSGPLYRVVARRIAAWHAQYGNVGAVVGATYPAQVREVRRLAPACALLIPGVGAQGGALEATVRAGVDAAGGNIIINASRSVLYASSADDFAARARETAQRLRDTINAARAGG